jgi:hypothetical protein
VDESTRLRNRIAELESLVRELRGTVCLRSKFKFMNNVSPPSPQVNHIPAGQMGTSAMGTRANGGTLVPLNIHHQLNGEPIRRVSIKRPMAEFHLSKSSRTQTRTDLLQSTTFRHLPAHHIPTFSQACRLPLSCLMITIVAIHSSRIELIMGPQ